jgi:hypothetical protein
MKEKKKGRHGRIVSDRHGHPLVWVIPLVADRNGGYGTKLPQKKLCSSLLEVSHNQNVLKIQHVGPVSVSDTTQA